MDEKKPLLKKKRGGFDDNDLSRENYWSGLKELWHQDCCPCIPARYILAIMGFFGFVNVYALRVNLSMAIIEMVNTSANGSSPHQFNWTSTQQGWVLSAFFFGYIIMQIPGGFLSGVIGGRIVFGVGIVMTAILTLLTPLAARIHIGLLIALRVLEGFFEGVTFPAMHSLWGKWAPPAERSILTTITYAVSLILWFSGPMTGNIISFPISALLCVYGFDGGWPSVFYVFGTLGTLWFIFWLLLGFDSPASHPRISLAERKYIESSIAEANKEETNKKVPIPWFQIMTSPSVWAIIVAHFCNNWGNYTLLTCIPSYFHDALDLTLGSDIIENGIFSAVPYVGFVIVTLVSGQIADFLRRKWLSTTFVRKIFTTLAFVLGAAGLLFTGYFGKTKLDAVLYLSISVGCSAMAMAGFNINHIDLAPRYAGILMGITNLAATIPGIVAPLVAKVIAKEPTPGENYRETYQDEWRSVFMLAAEIYLFGAAIYLILGDGKKQYWADGVGHERTSTTNDDEIKRAVSLSPERDFVLPKKTKNNKSIQHPTHLAD